ncbi:EGF-like growth factor [Sheeppox virus]|uniref:EGF-like growth factor n=2 Tax=Sheeppox virus TaxID=10266 RepID=A0A3F2YKH4_SHEVT|nr:EGF-like growth factor [Sheeppox virus]AVI09513.1 EGF-like growth factor [Sheeppox virus]AVI09647.1 EGF-like growth factor [Sheeppox virus]AWX92214.1 EGF-like growth factor [Sheeppox virus]AWX92215.1 EGF-like growth factor [Sheeppox virus]AWX92216.1 EGF-like growth factor [Sheeppox virus]
MEVKKIFFTVLLFYKIILILSKENKNDYITILNKDIMMCNKSINFCLNGGTCYKTTFILSYNKKPLMFCKCKLGYEGVRCHLRSLFHYFLKKNVKYSSKK